jgi:hypothetical protein
MKGRKEKDIPMGSRRRLPSTAPHEERGSQLIAQSSTEIKVKQPLDATIVLIEPHLDMANQEEADVKKG